MKTGILFTHKMLIHLKTLFEKNKIILENQKNQTMHEITGDPEKVKITFFPKLQTINHSSAHSAVTGWHMMMIVGFHPCAAGNQGAHISVN